MFIVSGLSGGGKTTLCSALSHMMGAQPIRTSDFLIKRLGEERDKEGRLFAWQDRGLTLLTDRELVIFQQADLDHLAVVQVEASGVHESMTLPFQISASEEICRVFLDVETEIRYRRVAGRHSIDLEDARLLVARKDAQTCLYIEQAYGLVVGSVPHLEHYDVIIRTDSEGTVHWQAHSVSARNSELLERAVQSFEQRLGRS